MILLRDDPGWRIEAFIEARGNIELRQTFDLSQSGRSSPILTNSLSTPSDRSPVHPS